MSTIKKIHSQTSNCDACQAVSVKLIINEEIQTPNLGCKDCVCGQYGINCECKEDIPKKRLTCDQIQTANASCEECNKSLMLNNEIHLPTLNLSDEALVIKTVSDQRESLNSETNIAFEGCPSEMSTNEEIYSRSILCNCQALPEKNLNIEETRLSVLNLSSGALPTKTDQSQSLSCKTHISGQGCSTKMSSDEEIHSRSCCSDALLTKMSYVEEMSSNDEALFKKKLFDSEHTMCQSSSKTCIACGFAKQILTDEALLASSRFNNKALSTKTCSDQSQSLSCESRIPEPPAEISTDEETCSRSSICEALLQTILPIEEMQSASPSCSGQAVCSKMLSDLGQSLSYGTHVAYEGSPSKRSTESLQCLCCKEHLLTKKSVTVGPNAKLTAMGGLSPLDPSSYSRPELAIIKHISLKLNVDFETQVLSGQAKIDFDVLQDINDLILDASNLKIESIQAEDCSTLLFEMGQHLPNMGSKLKIFLPQHLTAGKKNEDFCLARAEDEGDPSKPCPKDAKSSYDKFTSTLPEMINGCVYEPTMGCSKSGVRFSRESSATTTDGCCDNNILETEYHGYRLTIKIKYSTDPDASALQWLDPEQTSGKKHPYLFSQCQPIHARSILPCQDTPAVKFTYDAEVTAPEEFTVLMSALRGEQKNNKTTFRQPMPLPSYLVAIAVGVLESRTLGPRSKVWSEKEEIERSAWEFAETEKYLQAAEKLCGPYEWTQYDLLVLPPSFPYGGMENPCLTFVTPTLLAGDRSQADVIVHEIMHSWTGNLVTNRNFEHFWLNEGFTVFLERKVGASLINDSVEAKRSRDFQSLLGLQELNEAVNDVLGSTNKLTALVVNLTGVHPDDAFSTVPYEKGSLFLRYLEDLFGGPEVFDEFLRAYLTEFRKKSLETLQFQTFFVNYFKDNVALNAVDWDLWLYRPGMPPIIPAYDTTMTKAISALIVKIDDPSTTLSYEDVKTFTPHQMIHMLQQLIDRPALPVDRLATLGTEYRVNGNKNTEILYRWLRLCIRSKDHSNISEVFNFVNSQGRMKYVRPIYRDLYGWEDIRQQAIDNFLKNEKYMMHVSAYTLRKDLHLVENETTE